MASVKRVLIAGGDIAGMTLATAPNRSGIDAAIVEINPAWSVLGIGISVQGATLRALRSSGVLDRGLASGADPVGVLARANAALVAPR